jgi:hypothetical protein
MTESRITLDDIPPSVRAWFAAVGRLGAAQREIVISTCIQCGAEMRGLRTKRYCGDACRQRARRERR